MQHPEADFWLEGNKMGQNNSNNNNNKKKKRLWHRCFPVNFVKFLRTPFRQNTSGGRLLLTGLTKQTFYRSIRRAQLKWEGLEEVLQISKSI